MNNNKKQNEFKEKYKVPVGSVPITKDNMKSLHESVNKAVYSLLSDMLPYANSDVQNYLHNVVAAIMLEHEKYYEGFDLKIPYRFKSEKSKIGKTIDFFSNESKFTHNKENDKFGFSFNREILDIFGMKIIASNKRPTFNSSDPYLKDLIKEKKENHKFLGKMQGFQFKLIDSEFENPPHYKYTVTKREYYENCKALLEQIKTLIAPEATDLHEFYNNQISAIDEMVSLISDLGYLDNVISNKDFSEDSEVNFLNILSDFSLRVHDKLDLAVLTKQITSVFKDSEILNKLRCCTSSYN